MTQLHRFTGKTIIITGSSTGIGEGIARRFHEEGANVVINARNAEKCAAVADSLDPERTLVVAGDVSQSAFADEIVSKTVERFGALGYDIVIFPVSTLRVAMYAVEAFLADLNQTGSAERWEDRMQPRKDLYERLGYTPGQPWSFGD